jgi:hypothetical protein
MNSDIANQSRELPATGERRTGTAFDRVIAPLSRDEFLSRFRGKSYLKLSGEKGRFAPFFTWDDLNFILENHSLKHPRLRLVQDAKTLDPRKYFAPHNGRQRLRPASLVNCLSQGATLILDGVDELAPSVAAVAEAFEEALAARTFVNLYAGWRTQKGFDLHWDDQDTTILQLSGRKHWKVYGPTRLHPLRDDREEAPKPTGDPIWEGLLEDGDMLYMPRGWWHIAFPLDEPSLHLTVTTMPANGTDLLRWFTDELRRYADVRMNVPEPASAAERKVYISRIRELMLQFWSDDVLDRFLAEWNAVPLRPQVQLPFSPAECRAAITMETRVRLATATQLSFLKETGGSVSFRANGVRWECSASLIPALERLRDNVSYSVKELCALLPDPADTPGLTAFLTALAMGGVIWTASHEVPSDGSQA